MLPAVRLASELAWSHDPRDYWAVVTAAEAELYGALLDPNGATHDVREAYEIAGRLRPTTGHLDSTVAQLRWLVGHGVSRPMVMEALEGLGAGAGVPTLTGRAP